MSRISLLILTLLISLSSNLFSQNQIKIDSLSKVIQTTKIDTVKVNALNQLSWEIKSSEPEKAIQLLKEALLIAEKLNYSKGIANSWNNLGVIYYNQGDYNLALEYLSGSLKILEELKDKKGIAKNYNNIGNIYRLLGESSKALESHLKALKIREDLDDKQGMASSYNNIGLIYFDLNDLSTALDYFLKSMKIKEELNDKNGLSYTYSNIGNIFNELKKYPMSLDYHNKSLKIFEELNDEKGIALCYNNIGTVYEEINQWEKALEYHFKSLKIREQINDQSGIATSFINIANVYENKNKHIEAIAFRNKALEVSEAIGFKDGIKNAYVGLSSSYEYTNEPDKALHYFKLYTAVKDSMLNEENSKSIAEMQTKFDTEKKERQIELLKKEGTIKQLQYSKQEAELKKEKILRYSVLAGLALILLLGFVLYNRYKIKQTASLKLEAAYHQIEEKNKDITDSIRYAQNIQQAILPGEHELKKHASDSFILFRPKDIVSGDFYYFEPLVNKDSSSTSSVKNKFIIAAADCTGHGVPGAFMSIVGYHLLKQSVREHQKTIPSDILNELNAGVNESLNQSFGNSIIKDGMDIGLCTIDLEKLQLSYAGANNSLYLIRNGELREVKGDKFAIGASDNIEERKFSLSTLPLEKGDCIYLFSDGYADQFGGPKGKKLKYKYFKELLITNFNKSMSEQKELLNKKLEDWRGELQQVDDILIVGIKI